MSNRHGIGDYRKVFVPGPNGTIYQPAFHGPFLSPDRFVISYPYTGRSVKVPGSHRNDPKRDIFIPN